MKKYLLSILCGILLLPGCNYLDMVPEKDIETVESLFEQRTKVELWWKGLYAELNNIFADFRVNTAYLGADEFVTCQALHSSTLYNLDGLKIADGLQMSQNPYGSIWYRMYVVIRNCNIFLENVDHTYNMSEEDRNWWKADVKAVKAYVYFELVRRNGPICLVPQNMPVDLPVKDYQLPRQHVDTCFKEIINLLEESMEYVPKHSQRISNYGHTFSLEAVYALKAKVLLYAASPLFNGNEYYVNFKGKKGESLFSAEYDPEKWKRAAEAADAAVEMCESQGYKLKTGEGNKATKLLNQMRDIEMSIWEPNYEGEEAIFLTGNANIMNSYVMFTLPLFPEGHSDRYALLTGCVAPSMKMVEMFYTKNGLPLNVDKEWDYANRYKLGREVNNDYQNVVALNEDVLNLHLKREPRFYANVAADRCYWQRGPAANKNMLVQAYRGEAFGIHESFLLYSQPQNLCGYYVKKFSRSEVQTYQYTSNTGSLGDCRWPMIRLAELYLIQAEAWNEYLSKPDDKVYEPLNKVRRRAGIPDVEVAWKEFSTQPQKIESKEGMREIIQQENFVEFAFEGHRFWDLRRWKLAHLELNDKILGWNVLGENARTFYNNFEGPVVVWDKTKFVAPRDYLFPIKAEEAMIAGYVQNPGW